MSVRDLALAIKNAVDKRIEFEARARHGVIKNGLFQSGAKSFPFKLAVDCDTSEGSRVWSLLSTNRNAVIVGA